jgi:hypothetical protein
VCTELPEPRIRPRPGSRASPHRLPFRWGRRRRGLSAAPIAKWLEALQAVGATP